MKKLNIEGLLLFLFSGLLINQSLKLHKAGDWALSPALFPLIVSIGLFLFSLILIYRGFKGEGEEKEGQEEGAYKEPILLILLSLLYLVLLERLDFIGASLIYLGFFMWIMGEKRWWVLGSLSLATVFSLYYIFGNLLDVYLP